MRRNRRLHRFPLWEVIGFTLMLIAAFFVLAIDRAKASTAEGHVIGGDSAVAQQHAYSQFNATITGDIVFWEDTRPVAGLQNFTRIFFRNLSLPGQSEQMLTSGAGYFSGRYKGQANPDADGDVVVWEETVTTASGGRASEIRFIRLDECPELAGCNVHRVPVQQADQLAPSVSGHRIVWEDSRNGSPESDIYMYDIDSGIVQPLCTAAGKQASPQIDGEWVVWLDNRGGEIVGGKATNNDIYAMNVSSGEERRLTSDGGVTIQGPPAISGFLVVYDQESGDLSQREDIRMYDLSTGESSTIYCGPGIDRLPVIEGGRILWEACQSGPGSCRIWLFDLSTGQSQPISAGPESGGINALRPAVSADRVVWQDYRGGQPVIYKNRIGETGRALAERYVPELYFSHDIDHPARSDFEPRTVGLLLDGFGVRLITPSGAIDNPGLAALAENPGPDYYVDLPGEPLSPGFSDYSHPYLDLVAEGRYPVTAYSRVVANAEGSGKTVIQYWLCYYFNDWFNNHEGDWEMIEVILDGDLQPEAVAVSQHARAFLKYWDESGLEKTSGHARVYVAEGSHANYLSSGMMGRHYHEGKFDHTGDASAVLPAVDMDGLGSEGGWAGFEGHWGQEKPGFWPHVDSGPPGPRFQPSNPDNNLSPWDSPLGWALGGGKGDDNDLVIECTYCGEIDLYDGAGNHVGRNQDGGLDTQLVGSEYYERDEDASKNIIVHDSGAGGGYRLVISASPGGAFNMDVQAPNFSDGIVDTVSFETVSLGSGSSAMLEVGGENGYMLQLDRDGDGAADEVQQPSSIVSEEADYEVPGSIGDLTVLDTSSATVVLAWTAPGDDGFSGTVSGYELRYADEPITDASWQYAREAGSVPEPGSPGATETASVNGLGAGKAYYFAIRSRDEAWQLSPVSNIAVARTEEPHLTLTRQDAFWASYADYVGRELTVGYELGNKGTGPALDVSIAASYQSPGTVLMATPLPFSTGDIGPGLSAGVSLRYRIPAGVVRFTARTVGKCLDDAGRTHWFPGAPGT